MTTTPTWGPFSGPMDASRRLGGFVDAHVGPEVGICWKGSDGLIPIRRPSWDGDGYGSVLIVQFDDQSPTHPGARLGFFASVERALQEAMESYGEAELFNGQVALAQGQMIDQAIGSVFARIADRKNRSDGIGVLLDVIAVGLTIASIGTGVGAIAMLGFYAGCALLVMDGAAYGLEITGYDKGAEWTKNVTEIPRMIATAACLTDAAYGGYKAVREMVELKTLRAGSMVTAGAADAQAARVARGASGLSEAERMSYARRYADIAERARTRAATKARKLNSMWAHEVTPRATVPGSAYLLVDDELKPDNDNMVARYLRQYVFHMTSAKRR